MQKLIYSTILFSLFFTPSIALARLIDLQIEGGGVWQHRNDLQIPSNSQGTRFALDQYDSGPSPFYRLEGFYRFSKNHGLRALYAPFEVDLQNTPQNSVKFNGRTFNANQPIDFTYQFNSYRLTYFYAFWGHGDEQLNLGFTGKIRDADTRLTQNGQTTNYDNVGFVPLLYFEYQKLLGKNWFFHFNLDGLAGGPGRAFDFAFKLRRKIGNIGMLGIGTRVLDGGADNEKVFSFALFQYAVLEFVFFGF